MNYFSLFKNTLLTVLLLLANQANATGVFITEWMYSGNGAEYVEFTNMSSNPVDFTGWSYDDDSRIPGVFDLSGFGVVQHGESVIITEDTADFFREDWNLPLTIKVLGGMTNNLGRNDEINLFDNEGNLVDRLTYGDTAFSGTIRTQRISGNPISFDALGKNDPALWILSMENDVYGSYFSEINDLGNPGKFAPVPVPAAVWLMLTGLIGLTGWKKRQA